MTCRTKNLKTKRNEKNKKPPPCLATERRQIGEWEFANLSFPRWQLGAPLRGCQLPDAIPPRQAELPAS